MSIEKIYFYKKNVHVLMHVLMLSRLSDLNPPTIEEALKTGLRQRASLASSIKWRIQKAKRSPCRTPFINISRLTDLNCLPARYECAALPGELSRQVYKINYYKSDRAYKPALLAPPRVSTVRFISLIFKTII